MSEIDKSLKSKSIIEVQEDFKEKYDELFKKETIFIVAGVAPFLLYLFVPFFLKLFPLSVFFVIVIINTGCSCFVVYKMLRKLTKLRYQLNQLFKNLIELKVNGKILEEITIIDSEDSSWKKNKESDWKNIEVHKNNTVVKYTVKGSLGKKNEPIVEIKEMK